MPDACPDPSRLAAWSKGACPNEPDAEAIERHVTTCLRCAANLESLTRAQLHSLDLHSLRSPSPVPDPATRALLDTLKQEACSGKPITPRDPLPDFLAQLQPSSHPNSLGRFAGYEIEQPIGRGGMAAVFRAFDPTLQRRVAIKVLLHEGSTPGTAPATSRFLTEARAVAALRHPHIVEIYSAGQDPGWPFLVMPFHDQGTLQQWIDQGQPIGPDDVTRIALQLLDALETTHAQGILHRDLKPSNVLLEQGLQNVRLADFGLAQTVEVLPPGSPRTIAGTPSYMSPEQAAGDPLDARSDLYGLGALLHHLLTGHPPHASPPQPADIPPRWQPVLDRLLAPHPADRWPDAPSARQAIQALLHPPEPNPRRPRKLQAITRRLALLLSILLLLFGGLELSGSTSWLNSLLCLATGNGFYLRGRFGTYPDLAQAAEACRPGNTVIAQFHGPRITTPVRVAPHGLHVQAAPGYRPTLEAAPTAEPLFLALGPLLLEGLTLASPSGPRDAGQLIASEAAPIQLVHCRLLRLPPAGEDLLVRSGRRLDPDQPQVVHKPLLALRSGSSITLRGCVVAGLAATAFGIKGTTTDPIHILVDQSLFAIHRTLVLRPESGTHLAFLARHSAFASASLIELENAQALDRLAVGWDHCLLDRTGGTLLRWGRGGDGSWLERLAWTETNVVYAGSGDFAFERRHGSVTTESEWNTLTRLPQGSHRITSRPLFGEIRARSAQRLEAVDVDLPGLAADTGLPPAFHPDTVGDGPAYERFRKHPDHLGLSPANAAAAPPPTRNR